MATLSLDLDNQWSYLKTHGDPGWESFPSYFDRLIPRVLDFLAERGLRITVFVVGQDAALEQHHAALRAIANAGHEVGNHSFRHEPWLHLYSAEELKTEIAAAESAIQRAVGARPSGFRGPGFSCSPAVLELLARRGYRYDASTFPSFLGPLARAYYFLTARLSSEQRTERKLLFGRFAEGFKPLRPHLLSLAGRNLLEIPVTTMPFVKTPIHISYVLYLSRFSPALARWYFRLALALCRSAKVTPSILLHPLDFLGCDDGVGLEFFPAMDLTAEHKLAVVSDCLREMTNHFEVLALGEFTRRFTGEADASDSAAGRAGHAGDADRPGVAGEQCEVASVGTL
ncbi:MAG: polysaccharide deacetylase family protein [Pirellulales bacterium]|nr:polysaccharide deacetylase family protein [Pirellulales bacterium]